MTSVAWLSSVRVLKRLVNSNKRTKLLCISYNYTNAKDILEEEKQRQVFMTLINWATFMYYISLNNFKLNSNI